MAAIPRAQFFNHVVDTDIYIVKWQGKKRRIQAIMDEFTRFEAEARIKRETVQCEIKGFEKLWLGWAGSPIVLRWTCLELTCPTILLRGVTVTASSSS